MVLCSINMSLWESRNTQCHSLFVLDYIFQTQIQQDAAELKILFMLQRVAQPMWQWLRKGQKSRLQKEHSHDPMVSMAIQNNIPMTLQQLAFVTVIAKPTGLRSWVLWVWVQYLNWYTRAIPCTHAAVLRVPTGIQLHYAGATTINFSYWKFINISLLTRCHTSK